MLLRIARFEARYQLRSPIFIVGFTLFFLLAFSSVAIARASLGGQGNVNLNSPFAILQTVGIMNTLGIFVIIAFVANIVIRDDETGFAPILYTTRVTKFDYLIGRFGGAMAVAVLVMTSVPCGLLIGSLMPWVDHEKIGSFVANHYLYSIFVFSLPTLLVMGAGFFALATATRSMMWTYVGALGFLVFFGTTQVLLSDPSHKLFATLSDPFAVSTLGEVTRYWTAFERNTQLPAMAGLLLYNRLIWLGVSAAMFGAAYAVFRFDAPGSRKKPAMNVIGDSPTPSVATGSLSLPRPNERTGWSQLVALTRFDMRFVFRSPAFFVLLAFGIFNAFVGMMGTVESRGTIYFPVTRAIVEALIGAFSLIPTIVAIYYAGELAWRDRERRVHELVDATVAPDWAFMVPKIIAISLVLLACYSVGAITGILYQLFHGYTTIQPLAYILWFIVPNLINSLLLASLAVFVQALVSNKYLGWAAMLVYVVATTTLNKIGFQHNLYNFGQTPTVPLSGMNGMGRFWVARSWFHAYWLAFASMLLILAQLLWRRGMDARLAPRLLRLRHRLTGTPLRLLAGATLIWIGLGSWIFYNTNVRNIYRPSVEADERLANYEKALIGFEQIIQPHIVDVKLAVDLYPSQARAIAQGTYLIENRSGASLKEVHVSWVSPAKMEQLEIDGAKLTREFAQFDYRIYTFDVPMQPGEKRSIHFSTRLEEVGFPNSRALTQIVDNGTFLNNFNVTPSLGVSRTFLLKDRVTRRKYGLLAELRPPKLEDVTADAYHYLRHDSDWVTAEITLTTDADQVPISPGYTVSDTTLGDRRTLVTKTEAPIMNFFSLQSARYAVKKATYSSDQRTPVELAVYYYPGHTHNIQRMLDAMKASLELYGECFGPYQFHQARILEFPAYSRFAQAFANTIPYSEAIGFVQNHPLDRNDTKIDLVTYVTAHEMGHQWWAHQVIGADKQGSTMLSESFAQYSALLVMEKLYGKEMIRKFLKGELDSYLRGRSGEIIEELPLVQVENQPYIHYNKGALVMYWLKEAVSENVVNAALRKLLHEYAFKSAPYPSASDFVRLLRVEAGPDFDSLITDLFEKITVYDMKATAASATKRADGKYDVSVTVEGHKFYADGKGKETESVLDELFDIGLFTIEPGKSGYKRESVLLMKRRPIKSGKQEITFVVDQLPKIVGIDPFNIRIDRNSDDNFAKVELQASDNKPNQHAR